MAVERITVHCVDIEDKPGSLQKFLTQASLSGVDFLCFVACTLGGNRGRVCLSAKDQVAFESFAKEAELKTETAAGFIIGGEDKKGAAAEALKGLAEDGVNGIAGCAVVFDGKYRLMVAVNAADADRAEKALKA